MDGHSLNITNQNIEKLKSLFPEAFTEGRVDWEKLKAAIGQDFINFSNERYVLNWAGKSEAFKVLQTPTTATLAPVREESINFDTTQNIFIEGENLEVLKALQKSYFGKVKMIYIDPPYNTGSDSFIYPDKFSESKEDYLRRIGEKDTEGYLLKEGMFRKNSKENGQYHSNWLNMMFPRLYLARNLMREDGVIFVSIDDNEVHNLRLLMNEIFGEENFVGIFPWKKRSAKSDVPFGVSQDFEWIIAFTRGEFQAGVSFERKYYSTPDFPKDKWRLSDLTTQRSAQERQNSNFTMVDPKTNKEYPVNPNRVWGVTKDTFQEYYDEGKIVFPDDYDFLKITIPAFRVFESEDKKKSQNKFGTEEAMKSFSTSLPKEIGMSEDGNKEIVRLFGAKVFSYPKPVALIRHFLNSFNDKDAIILDFFAGSGTTARAVFEENVKDGGKRRFILIQLPEETEKDSDAGKSGYRKISSITIDRIKKDISELETKSRKREPLFSDALKKIDLGFKTFNLKSSNFKIWRGDMIDSPEDLDSQISMFEDPVKQQAEEENMLWELILKQGLELTVKVEQKGSLWLVNEGELVVGLKEVNESILEEVLAMKPKHCIILDRLFEGKDQMKTNARLQMRDAGVGFKTI